MAQYTDLQLSSLTYKKARPCLPTSLVSMTLPWRSTTTSGTFARTGLPSPLTSTSYNPAHHQTAFGSQVLSYDNNLMSDECHTYTWDARNQLVAITPSGLSASFQYDGVGRRSTNE